MRNDNPKCPESLKWPDPSRTVYNGGPILKMERVVRQCPIIIPLLLFATMQFFIEMYILDGPKNPEKGELGGNPIGFDQ